MKNKLIKKVTATLLLSAIVLSPVKTIYNPSFADYQVLHTSYTNERISSGVMYNEKLMFTDIGWVSVKYMTIDLNDPNTYIDVLYNKEDITVRNKLSTLSSSDKLVGSINGDFFDYGAKSTLGTIVSGGEFISTGIHDGKFASFNISKLGIPFLQNWTSAGIKMSSADASLDIQYKNKPYLDFNRAIIYDKNWKDKSYGNTLGKDIVEIIIKDQTIVDIRQNQAPVNISDDITVISAVGTKINQVLNNFKAGDSVNIKYDINFSNIETSIGGGSIILENGKIVTELSLPVPGRHPRTSVGISKDKSKLIYAVVEGRTSSYVGVTEGELAQIMLGLGSHNALNLDGGGSTEMIKKYLGSPDLSIVNRPSDGVERPIFTGLGVFDTSEKGNIEKLDIEIADEAIIGAEMNFNAFTRDENYFRSNLDSDKLMISFDSGSFKLEKNKLIPTKEGRHKIEFTYMDSSITKYIDVSDLIVDLNIKNAAIVSDINSKTPLLIEAIDENGFRHKIDYGNLSFELSNDKLGYIDENYNFVSSNEKASGYLTIKYKDIKKHIKLVVGDNYKTITDFEPNEEMSKKLKFTSYPEANKGNLMIHNFGINNSYGALLEYDFTYTTKTRAAYISFGDDGYLLDDSSHKLGLSVFGNYGNTHWLRAKVIDADNKSHNIDFASNVNWEGWKYVEASLPSTLKRPLKLDRIYLVEDEASKLDRGVISIDRLVQVGTSNVSVDLPKDTTKTLDINKSKLDKDLDFKVNIFTKEKDSYKNLSNNINIFMTNTDNKKSNEIFDITSKANKYLNTDVDGVRIMNLVNYNDSIRKSGYGQWMDLLRLKDNMDSKALVIILSSGKNFKDPLEENLFYDTIRLVEKKYNIPAVVVYPSKTNTSQKINSIDVIGFQSEKLSSKDYLDKYLSIGFKNDKTSYEISK